MHPLSCMAYQFIVWFLFIAFSRGQQAANSSIAWCPASIPVSDIRFVYEETREHPDTYYGKYSKISIQYQGNGGAKRIWLIQQQQNAANRLANQEAQQQQMPFQSQLPLNNINPIQMQFPFYSTSTSQEPLSIWKLKIPRSARHVYVIPLAKELEPFEATQEDLDNPNITFSDSSSEFNSYMDVTVQGITNNVWYVVCVNNSIIQNGQKTMCQQCTLIKACNVSSFIGCYNKVYAMSVDDTQSTTTSVVVQYSLRDLPPGAFVTTEVFEAYGDNRCRAQLPTRAVDSAKYNVEPNTWMEVRLKNLNPQSPFTIKSTLEFPLNTELAGVPSQIQVLDYLNPDSKVRVSKCEFSWELLATNGIAGNLPTFKQP